MEALDESTRVRVVDLTDSEFANALGTIVGFEPLETAPDGVAYVVEFDLGGRRMFLREQLHRE